MIVLLILKLSELLNAAPIHLLSIMEVSSKCVTCNQVWILVCWDHYSRGAEVCFDYEIQLYPDEVTPTTQLTVESSGAMNNPGREAGEGSHFSRLLSYIYPNV